MQHQQAYTRTQRRVSTAFTVAATLAALGALAPLGAQVTPGTPGATTAAQPAPRTIGFDDAVSIALRQNIAMRQAENGTASSAASVRQQQMQFLPSVSFSTSTAQNLGRTFNEAEGRIVDQASQSVNAGIFSSVTLFDGLGNLAELREARLSEEASVQDLARTKQTVVFTVASNFLSLVAQQEQLRVQEQNLVALEATEQQIERFVQAGTRAISDLYQQQASVAAARAAVVDTRRALELAKVDLIGTLQLDPAGTYDFVPPAIADTAAATPRYDLDALLARAFAARTDLQAEGARVAAAEQGVKAAEASRWPTVSLSVGYSTAYTSATDLAFTDQLDQRRGGSVAIGVSIPIFDRGSTSIATEQAQLQAGNARLALAQQRQTVALEVRRAYLDLQSATEQLAAAQARQRAADLAVTTTEARWRVGAATLLELTQARTVQVEAASALVNARYGLVFQRSLLSYYTGELDPAAVRLG